MISQSRRTLLKGMGCSVAALATAVPRQQYWLLLKVW